MEKVTTPGGAPDFVPHAEREWAYGRNSNIGRLDEALDEAQVKGWVLKDGHLLIMVELRDKGDPGSTYALVYHQDSDRLVGIYFQAAVQKQFEVVFQRIE